MYRNRQTNRPDPGLMENHLLLKRNEKWKHRKLRRSIRNQGMLARCRIRRPDGRIALVSAQLVCVFERDVCCLSTSWEQSDSQTRQDGRSNRSWLARNAIDWSHFLQATLLRLQKGWPLHYQFLPQRVIPPTMLASISNLPPSQLQACFAALRKHGFLRELPSPSRENCPPGTVWDTLVSAYQDFQGVPW